MNRDDFSPSTKRNLAGRVGYRCSFTGCGAHTVGPSDEANDAVNNVGVAAHIEAAAPGGRRYDASMTPEARASFDNGIWLCQTHAKLIDGDEARWTVTALQSMKATAEADAEQRMRRSNSEHHDQAISLESAVCVYIKSYRAAYVAAVVINGSDTPITIKSVQLRLGNDLLAPNKPRENLVLEGCAWLPPGPVRLKARDAVEGAWFFGWSFPGGGRHVEAEPGSYAELTLNVVGGAVISVPIDFIHPDDPTAGAKQPACARSTSSASHLKHDIDLFRRLDAVLPEVRLLALAERLQTSDDYLESDVDPCRTFLDCARLETNRFCDDVLNSPYLALIAQVHQLLGFLAANFFVYPSNQPPGGDAQFALYPELNVDRGARVDPAGQARYCAAQTELDHLIQKVREAYHAYRASVRRCLAE